MSLVLGSHNLVKELIRSCVLTKVFTNGGEDCQGEHESTTEGPDPDSGIIPYVSVLHVLHCLLLEPDEPHLCDDLGLSPSYLRQDYVPNSLFPLLWSEDIVLIGDEPDVVGVVLASLLRLGCLGHLAVCLYVLEKSSATRHVGSYEHNHSHLGEHECQERPNKRFYFL